MKTTADARWERHLSAARSAGSEDGTAAGTWFFDGSTPERTYRVALRGIEDLDPMVLDCLPFLDLSGQWADGPTTHGVLSRFLDDPGSFEAEEQDDLIEEYRQAYDDAVLLEVERSARAYLAE